MAGLGRKTFIATEVLTAANVNGYLMDQSVMKFASSAARSSAIGTAVSEGMVSYLDDTNTLEVYNGSSWGAVSSSSTGNAIINGGFDIWQRGTSVAFGAVLAYGCDRFQIARAGWTSGATVSRQAGTTDIRYAARVQRDSGNTSTAGIEFGHTIETANSVPFAGKTATLSFYARSGANYSSASSALSVKVYTGTGTDQSYVAGFTGSTTPLDSSATLTTSWQRFTYSVSVGSTATEIGIGIGYTPVGTAGAADYFEITGMQFEIGSSATAFRRNADTIQGELAACQRYYVRNTASGFLAVSNIITGNGTTKGYGPFAIPVTMRTTPTSVDFSNIEMHDTSVGLTVTAAVANGASTASVPIIEITVASGVTAYRNYWLRANAGTGYIGLSAEL
jgi:hypothetical protein